MTSPREPTQAAGVPLGNLFVVAAPSGGGKTSLVRALLARDPAIRLSVSYTTRAPRVGEREGSDYQFVGAERFAALKSQGEFLEHAFVHGNWYATSATWLKAAVDAGQDVLLEIDWQGAQQVRRLIPGAVQIFILPPSLQSLEERLVRRAQDAADTIAKRLSAAHEEVSHCDEFDYVIINQEFASAVDDLLAIVRATRLRTAQQRVRYGALIAQLT
jgi:guanylate kinase